MISKLKIYLDTSVISALYDVKNFERQDITARFFEHLNNFDTYISEVVVMEIEKTGSEEFRFLLLKRAELFTPLCINQKSWDLALEYVLNGAISKSSFIDALHLAIAAVNGVDHVVSWNFKDMVNDRIRYRIWKINERNSLKSIGISTPLDLLLSI